MLLSKRPERAISIRMKTTTYGVGLMIKHALEHGATRIINIMHSRTLLTIAIPILFDFFYHDFKEQIYTTLGRFIYTTLRRTTTFGKLYK
jgi:hypothetical protein